MEVMAVVRQMGMLFQVSGYSIIRGCCFVMIFLHFMISVRWGSWIEMPDPGRVLFWNLPMMQGFISIWTQLFFLRSGSLVFGEAFAETSPLMCLLLDFVRVVFLPLGATFFELLPWPLSLLALLSPVIPPWLEKGVWEPSFSFDLLIEPSFEFPASNIPGLWGSIMTLDVAS